MNVNKVALTIDFFVKVKVYLGYYDVLDRHNIFSNRISYWGTRYFLRLHLQ